MLPEFKILLIGVVCGIIGLALAMMLNLAVANEVITMSAKNLNQFTIIIILLALMLGMIIGVASKQR